MGELTEDEEKLIDQKPGQVSMLKGRRKGKKGHEYEVVWYGHKEGDDTLWMSKDNLLRFKWLDAGDKKRPEYECGDALQKLMMQHPEAPRLLQPRDAIRDLLQDLGTLGRTKGQGGPRRGYVDGAARAHPRRAYQLPRPRFARSACHRCQELCRRCHHHLPSA